MGQVTLVPQTMRARSLAALTCAMLVGSGVAASAREVKGTLTWPDQWIVFPLPGPVTEGRLDQAVLNTIPERLEFPETTVAAQTVKVTENRLDLAPLFGGVQKGDTAYVFLALASNVAQDVTLGLGADWWLRAWLNGKEIVNTLEEGNTEWPPHLTNHTRDVPLRKGRNVLAVKFVSGSGSSVLTMGGPDQLRDVPPDRWQSVAAPATPSTYPIVQVDYSNRGIDVVKATIVLGSDTIPPEETAARELAEYLRRSLGKELAVVREGREPRSDNLIYIGPTRQAAENGIDAGLLRPEQWLIRTANGNLILAGGRPRGVLYAVYHFLETVVGVRWWNPWEEFVPERQGLATGELDLGGEPAYRLRHLDTYNLYMTAAGKERLWAPRHRVNRELYYTGKPGIPGEYGGGYDIGPPGFVHTEGKYYKALQQRDVLKPEWVAMRDGKREILGPGQPDTKYQLCLSNAEAREALLVLLKDTIRKTRTDESPPTIFDVSLNDTSSMCECEPCEALRRKYGNDTGLLLDFLNPIADGVKEEFPDIVLSTLAYMQTERVPVAIKPRDNIMVVLCDTLSTYTAPIPGQSYFGQRLAGWSGVTNKLCVWDYHTNFLDPAMPMPFESTLQPDLQLFHRNHAFGFLDEFHSPIFEDMRDLRLWLLARLLEDPYCDQNRLIADFTAGFYGPAGSSVREYLKALQQAAEERPSKVTTMCMLESCKHVTPDFLLGAQRVFDRAEEAVVDSEMLRRRVRHARLAVDKATYVFFPRIERQFVAQGGRPADIPLNREAIAERIRNTVEQQMQLRAGDLIPARQPYVASQKESFLEFLAREVLWEACENLGKITWDQLAWRPKSFTKEEIGSVEICTDTKLEGTGSLHWVVTADAVDKKLLELPGLQFARLNYLYGQDFSRNTQVKFHLKCENPKHPPVFAGLSGGQYPDIKVLEKGEVTDGWKEIVWDLKGDTGDGWTHIYFRLYLLPGQFGEEDVLDLYLDNMRLVR